MSKYVVLVLLFISVSTAAYGEEKKEPKYRGEKLSDLIKQLNDKGGNKREHAVYALGEIKSKIAVNALIKVLDDENDRIRFYAASFLVKLGEFAIPQLINMLDGNNNEARAKSAELLCRIKSKSTVPALIKALGDKYWSVRTWAARALGNIKDKTAVPALYELVKSKGWSECYAGALAIVKIGRAAVPALVRLAHNEENHSYIADILHSIGMPAASELIKNLDSKDEKIRQTSAALLHKMSYRGPIPKYSKFVDRGARLSEGKKASLSGNKVYDSIETPKLIKALKNKDAKVRNHIIWVLNAGDEIHSIPHLIAATQDLDHSVRKSAVRILGRFGNPIAVPNIIKALQDENKGVRESAVRALGKIGDKSAIPALLRMLHSKNRIMRINSAKSLGKIGNESAVPALIKALSDTEISVRCEATEALGKIKSRIAVPNLIKALGDKSFYVRRDSAEALGKIGDKSAVPELCKLINDKEYEVKNAVFKALKKMPYKAAIPSLAKVMEGNGSYYFGEAIDILGETGDKAAVPALLKFLKNLKKRKYDNHTTWDYQERVVKALAKCGDKSIFPLLLTMFLSEPGSCGLSESLADTMAKVDPKAARKEFIRTAEQKSGWLLKVALRQLCKSPEKLLIPLLKKSIQSKDERDRLFALEQLSKYNDKSLPPLFIKAVNDGDWSVRYKAVRILGELKCIAAIPALIKIISQSQRWSESFRSEAAKALAKIGKPAIPAVIEKLNIEKTGNPQERARAEDVRYYAAKILGDIKGKSAVSALINALEKNDGIVAQGICFALGKIGDKTAVPALIKLIKSENRDIEYARMDAIWALGKIGDSSVLPELVKIFKNNRRGSWFRSKIANVFGKLKAKEAVNALLEGLSAKKAELQKASALALAKIGDKSIIPKLVTRTREKNLQVCLWAHYVLAALGSDSKLNSQSIMNMLQNGKELQLRKDAVFALGELRYAASVSLFREYLENEKTRYFCIFEALSKINSKRSVEILVRAIYEGGGGCNVSGSLGRTGNKRVVPALILEVRRGHNHCRGVCAARALKNITGEDYRQNIAKWQQWWDANKDKILKDEKGKTNKDSATIVIRLGEQEESVLVKLCKSGAIDIARGVGIMRAYPADSKTVRQSRWFKLADNTCLSMHFTGKTHKTLLLSEIILGEPGKGYGGKFNWLKQKTRDLKELVLPQAYGVIPPIGENKPDVICVRDLHSSALAKLKKIGATLPKKNKDETAETIKEIHERVKGSKIKKFSARYYLGKDTWVYLYSIGENVTTARIRNLSVGNSKCKTRRSVTFVDLNKLKNGTSDLAIHMTVKPKQKTYGRLGDVVLIGTTTNLSKTTVRISCQQLKGALLGVNVHLYNGSRYIGEYIPLDNPGAYCKKEIGKSKESDFVKLASGKSTSFEIAIGKYCRIGRGFHLFADKDIPKEAFITADKWNETGEFHISVLYCNSGAVKKYWKDGKWNDIYVWTGAIESGTVFKVQPTPEKK